MLVILRENCFTFFVCFRDIYMMYLFPALHFFVSIKVDCYMSIFVLYLYQL